MGPEEAGRPWPSEIERSGVPRLVEQHAAATWDLEGDGAAEAAALDTAGERGSLGRQLGDGLLDVVADKRDLMMCRPAIGRMDAKFRRARSEDEPALVRIDVRPAEHVAEEGARGLGVVCMDSARGDP